MQPRRSHVPIIAPVLAAVLLAGCGANQARRNVGHYLDPTGGFLTVNRVVLLPLANNTDFPGVEESMTAEVLQAIQTRRLFHVQVAPPTRETGDRWCPVANQPLTLKELAEMRRTFGCDAVLVGGVTAFQPYPHMQAGLCLRLIDLRDGSLLWAVDHAWDTSDRQTQQRIEAYYRRCVESGDSPLQRRIALVSSRAFQRFVARETAETLPEREILQ